MQSSTQVHRRDRGRQGVGIQRGTMRHQLDFGIDRGQATHCRIDLAQADAVGVVDDLALQVGQVDRIEVGQVQLADARGGQVQGHRSAQATQADDQYAAGFESQLAVDVDVLQQNLPAVAQQLLIVQHGRLPKLMRS